MTLPDISILAVGAGAAPATSGSVPVLIAYIAIAIGTSFFCSVWEAVLLSITRPYIANLKKEKPKTGAMLERLKDNLNAPLTSILTLNTVAHTVGAMGVGAQVSALVGGGMGETIAGALMTLAVLILSEIIPKNLGATHWRTWAPWVGRCLEILSKIMWPFVKLVSIFAPGGHGHAEFSRDELRVMAEMGRKEGKLKEEEMRILHNLLHFRDYSAHDVMTPRVVVFALPGSMTVAEFLSAHSQSPFSRIPIYENSLDGINGFVLKSDVLAAAAEDRRDLVLSGFQRDLPTVAASVPLPTIFKQFSEDNTHIASVLDEFGGFEGLVTMEDIVETLLGMEIIDELDTNDDMQKLARTLWAKRAARMGISLGGDTEEKTSPPSSSPPQ